MIKKFLVLIAIFCVIGSAGAVSAGDAADEFYLQEANYNDSAGTGGYNDTDGSESQYNSTDNETPLRPVIDPDYAHTEQDSNQTANAGGESEVSNVTSNATANATTSHSMPKAGNPIFGLLSVCAVLGGYAIISKRR